MFGIAALRLLLSVQLEVENIFSRDSLKISIKQRIDNGDYETEVGLV